jgi:hypothetical protein
LLTGEVMSIAAGVMDRAWLWVLEGQRVLTTGMTNAARQLKTGNIVTSTAVLAAISFLYGIFSTRLDLGMASSSSPPTRSRTTALFAG